MERVNIYVQLFMVSIASTAVLKAAVQFHVREGYSLGTTLFDRDIEWSDLASFATC
jgi:hypothetical protein